MQQKRLRQRQRWRRRQYGLSALPRGETMRGRKPLGDQGTLLRTVHRDRDDVRPSLRQTKTMDRLLWETPNEDFRVIYDTSSSDLRATRAASSITVSTSAAKQTHTLVKDSTFSTQCGCGPMARSSYKNKRHTLIKPCPDVQTRCQQIRWTTSLATGQSNK